MPEQLPLVSIIMVDGSFREEFFSIDYFENQTLSSDQFEILWVEYFDKVDPKLEEKLFEYSNLKVLRLKRKGDYHSSYCFNAGLKSSRGEIIVIPDADVVVEENFLELLLKEHVKNEDLVLYIYRYDEPKDAHSKDINIVHLKESTSLSNPYNYGGCVSTRKKWLFVINGYEEHEIFSTGFHANGLDVYTRFKNLGLPIKWHPTMKLFHPWHPSTLIYHQNYETQKVVIDYRSKHLLTSTFQGIDNNKNIPFPDDLFIQIEKMRTENERVPSKIKVIPGIAYLVNFLRKYR